MRHAHAASKGLCLALSAVLAACAGESTEEAGPGDGGESSGGDAGPVADGGAGNLGQDAGPALADSGSSDAGGTDAGSGADAGTPDAGPAVTLGAILDGERLSPAVATPALGSASFTLTGSTLAFRLHHDVQSGVSATVLDASGAAIASLTPFGPDMSGTLALTPQQAASLAGGGASVVVTSALHVNGEIGGRIQLGTAFHADLRGSAEVPAVATSASGEGAFLLVGSTLTCVLQQDVSNGTMGHIHQGPATLAFGPLMYAFVYGARMTGQVSLTDAEVNELTTDSLYIQIHSNAYPTGEIRGQLVP